MDHYERAYFNGVLGTQNVPAGPGVMLYNYPLGMGQSKADSYMRWGSPYGTFTCCYGTGSEQWSKMGDSIYFKSASDTTLYVNLYVPSTLKWATKGVTITQHTTFPLSGSVSFTITTQAPVTFGLNLHIPYWVAPGGKIIVNGQTQNILMTPSTYATINRSWANGDILNLTLPMKLHAHAMIDNKNMISVMYGPLVLGGLTTTAHTLPVTDINNLENIITQQPGAGLTFTAKVDRNAGTMTMVPLYTIVGSTKYGVYWTIQV